MQQKCCNCNQTKGAKNGDIPKTYTPKITSICLPILHFGKKATKKEKPSKEIDDKKNTKNELFGVCARFWVGAVLLATFC